MITVHTYQQSLHEFHMELHKIDLNLLLLFDALYRQRSVKLASEEMFISQSACSHALSRLRLSLEDELFVRVRNEMVPTARAQKLAPKVGQALRLLQEGLSSEAPFDPSKSKREFVFAATDYTGIALLPKLMAHIEKCAPNISIRVVQTGQKLPFGELESGEIDFALGFTHEAESSSLVVDHHWLTDSYCILARVDHPDIQAELDLKTYLNQQHVMVAPWNERIGIVDKALKELGLKRRVGLQVPSVMVAPFIVAESNMLVTSPLRVAKQMIKSLPLCLHEPPFPIPKYQLKLYWHRLKTQDSSYRWMQQTLFSLLF